MGSWAVLSLTQVQLWLHNGYPSLVLTIFSPSHLHSVTYPVSVSSVGDWSSDQALLCTQSPEEG